MEMLIQWKDQYEHGFPLKLIKENYPVETEDYAKDNTIDNEPAFQWWISYTFKKLDAILSAANARLRNNTIKYGIKVSRSVNEAKDYDQENGNTLWQDSIDLKMNTIVTAFEIAEDDKLPPRYMKSSGHLIFDNKIDVTRKAKFIKDGY